MLGKNTYSLDVVMIFLSCGLMRSLLSISINSVSNFSLCELCFDIVCYWELVRL